MRLLLLAPILLLAACSGPAEPKFEVPASAEEIEFPDVYAEWWAEVEEDVGVFGNLDRLRLFAVPRPWYNRRYGRTVHGIWVPDGRIYLVRYLVRVEGLVKHEFLHEILGGDRTHSHPLFAVYDEPGYGQPPSE